MDRKKFLNNFKGSRAQFIIRYCYKEMGWFLPDEMIKLCNQRAKEADAQQGKKSEGRPNKTIYEIKYFAKIGFIFLDPQKGIKVNRDFVPNDQKE